MSLLLEALKRAEKAKEEAQRRERGESAAEVRAQQDESEPKPVLTRSELPDIKQPLEILTDEISPKEAAAKSAGLPRSGPAKAESAKVEAPQVTERATARKVFEAKYKEANPRLPFYITLAVLGAFAVGTVVYFWYQLRPPPPLVNTSPVRPANEAPVQVSQAGAAAPAAVAAPAQAAIPGLPPAATPAIAVKPASPEPRVQAPAPKPKPAPRIARPAAPEPVAATPEATISSRRAAPPQIHPKVQTAYAAYLKGDFSAARAGYEEALREQPTNRDALLGVAAIDVRTGRLEVAEATYLRLLHLDPRDAHAQAGLIALRASRLDPLSTESRVKSMLAADPEAHVLHFTLGNQLAQQGRWAEAQQEYFKAFAANPENADFAYNLAVSLDHLRQGKLALEYYQRAITLAESRGASFNVAAARQRAAQLER
jgi:tetratricopeptide (TPR) repeat protein